MKTLPTAINFNDGLSRVKIDYNEHRENSHQLLLAAGFYLRATEKFEKHLAEAVDPNCEISYEYVKAENASLGIARIKKMFSIAGQTMLKQSDKECEKISGIDSKAIEKLEEITTEDVNDKDKLDGICEEISIWLQEEFELKEAPFIDPLILYEVLEDLTSSFSNLEQSETIKTIFSSDNIRTLNTSFKSTLKRSDVKRIVVVPYKDGPDTLKVIAPINEGRRKWVVKSTKTGDEYVISSFEGQAAKWVEEYMRGEHLGITSRDNVEVTVSYNRYEPVNGKPRVRDAVVSKLKVNYDSTAKQESLF
ncbi:hypothetical protein BC455_21665 [Vibrio harveyi]|uniref:hypothetical protein n=1 Tax=Vibrio harveyi TaxID=669 RepID=UPI0008418DF5|nr:hypothetical protein [Vibrio harveyi]ODM56414.1 hypothetical protein BC455_21665 [Vibrio harveyi]